MYCNMEKCAMSNNFVYMDLVFTLVLMITTLLQYKQVIKYSYGFQLAVLGMIFTTILIVINGITYGYFKNKYEDD